MKAEERAFALLIALAQCEPIKPALLNKLILKTKKEATGPTSNLFKN